MSTTAISIVLASPAFSPMVHPTGTSCDSQNRRKSPTLNTDPDLLSGTGRSDETRSKETHRFSRVRSRAACICSDEGVVANVTADVVVVVGVVLKAVAWPGADGCVEAAGGVEVDANDADDADDVDDANVAGEDEARIVEVLELENAVMIEHWTSKSKL
jgi:hypothetical protein